MVRIRGNICAANLSLPHHIAEKLADMPDMVIHCAAITAFDADESQYQAINVQGTENMLRLFPDTPFLHVSTAYICGEKDGPVAEGQRDPRFDFTNGYERSKAAAEALVTGHGGGAVIVRPSIVVGAHEDGAIGRFDNFYGLFRLIADGHISTLPASGHARLDFVPICHVASGITDILRHWDRAAGQIIHLASGQPVTTDRFIAAISAFPQLHAPRRVAPDRFDMAKLPPFERRLHRHVASRYHGYFTRNPEFRTERLHRISGRTCPPMDDAALSRLIRFCIDRKFVGMKADAI